LGKKTCNRISGKKPIGKLVRAHQVAQNGIEFPFYPDQRVVTIFSASHYLNNFDNKAAIAKIDEDGYFSHSEIISSRKIEKPKRVNKTVSRKIESSLFPYRQYSFL
jgi:hypothetical protein